MVARLRPTAYRRSFPFVVGSEISRLQTLQCGYNLVHETNSFPRRAAVHSIRFCPIARSVGESCVRQLDHCTRQAAARSASGLCAECSTPVCQRRRLIHLSCDDKRNWSGGHSDRGGNLLRSSYGLNGRVAKLSTREKVHQCFSAIPGKTVEFGLTLAARHEVRR